MSRFSRWSNLFTRIPVTQQRLRQLSVGIADQGLSVGGMFMVNVVLARVQTKEEYGMFALSYSIFTFLSGLHNATVLEPFTIYASGRYRDRFPAYWRLMMGSNGVVGLSLSAGLLLACLLFWWVAPSLNSPSLLGLALSVSFILTGLFLRRSFYVICQPQLAAKMSLLFFTAVAVLLWCAARAQRITGFSVFLILALAWVVAGLVFIRKLPHAKPARPFLKSEPRYWREHWIYARWVLATAFVFQFTHQGYYWLVAGFLSVKEVGELKAMYVLIAPIEQVTISVSFLFLPMLAARYVAGNKNAFLAFWRRYSVLTLGITATFAVAVRVLGTQALHILYAGKFDELAPMLFLLALVPLVMAIGGTTSDAIRAAEKPGLVFYAYVSSAIATFLLGLPLVKYFGLRGAVYGMLVSAATYSLALAVAFRLNLRARRMPVGVAIYNEVPSLPTSEGVQ
jgi:O-antigen/teichoic acid export membrane protein